MTELIKLDDRYVNPEHITFVEDLCGGYGGNVTFVKLITSKDDDDVLRIRLPFKEVMNRLQKSDNFKVIE